MTAEPQGTGSEASTPEQVAAALETAARKSGIAKVEPGEAPSARALLAAVGGVRGLIETILPGAMFLVVYTLTSELVPSVVAPFVVALIFVGLRLVTRTPASSAIAGAVGIALSAGVALMSGRAEDNFVLGFFVNGGAIVLLLGSLLVRWPLIGLIMGALSGDALQWREQKAKYRVAAVTTLLWTCVFAARLMVQLPLYFTSQTEALAVTKLVMGVPLYAATLWITWLLVRRAYERVAAAD
ncbi:DUF3159 domain-containing protein [Ruicaihuangia caeni]|uniref:DUF3159 domain-containing protein n=1 Tax=Ruicaihuangia caeni TaxID=3042517 RepID=UPI00338D8A56